MTLAVKDATGATQSVSTIDDLDKGVGTSGAKTQRVILDSSQFQAPGPTAKAAATSVTMATDEPTIVVAQDVASLANGGKGTLLTPQFAAVVASSSGVNAIVAAAGVGKKIRVIAWDVKVNAAVNFKWQSAANDKTGLYYCSGQGDGVARAFNPVGYFETNANEALNLNLSGAVAVGGCITYVVV